MAGNSALNRLLVKGSCINSIRLIIDYPETFRLSPAKDVFEDFDPLIWIGFRTDSTVSMKHYSFTKLIEQRVI
uniref:AraC family transcriptional regulator n=1 Tax=Syphacia muris TaxID=451379 RepID=A0A0N5AP91_9BILA